MGIEHGFMEYLSAWEGALDSPAELTVLRRANRRTPASFKQEDVFPDGGKGGGITANQCCLIGAVALVDAVDLRCPGTDEGKAIQLVESLFELQAANGFMCLGGSRQECLTPSHAQLWEAAMAAVLYVSWRRGVQGLFGVVSAWWRQYLDLCRAHLVAAPEGPVILTPGQRGADAKHPDLATNSDRDAIYAFVNHGHGHKVKDSNQYMLGTRLFQGHLENVPLPKAHEIPLPQPLHLLRYADGFVSWFPVLSGLNVQWMVGTTKARPERAILVKGGWAVVDEATGKGGACPAQPPPGWTAEKVYPPIHMPQPARSSQHDE